MANAESRTSISGLARRRWNTIFINRNFALLWWGQSLSSVGDYAWDTALVLWIATTIAAGQPWAPLAVAGAVLAAMIPQIIVAPIAGVFVDRWDRRQTMIVMAMIQVALAGLLAIAILAIQPGRAQHYSIWLLGVVFANIVLLTTCAQFFQPAQLALIKDIVAPSKQDQAIEMTRATQALGVVIGPPLAAALVFGLGVEWALIVNALTFGVSYMTSVLIIAPPYARRFRQRASGTFWSDFTAGLAYVANHATLRTILVAEILTWLGFGALQALGYFFITINLRAPPGSYGAFASVFGLGAILGGLLVTLFGRAVGLRRILWLALITSGVFVALMSHLTQLAPALVAAFIFGVAATAIMIAVEPLALDTAESEFVGRVTTVLDPAGRLAALVSVIIAGSLYSAAMRSFHASVMGINLDGVNVIFTGTGALAVAGGIYTWWHMRGLSDPTPQSAEDVTLMNDVEANKASGKGEDQRERQR
jgi:MFS family permease